MPRRVSDLHMPCEREPTRARVLAQVGTELYVTLRKKKQAVTITKMPFVPQNYYRGP